MMKKNTEAGDDMTQKERILNAKHCLDALALGLDPATGAELPDDSVLNRVELSRCFFFVSGLLQELHERGGQGLGLPFALPAEQRAQFPFSERPMLISEICRILNEMADPFVYRQLRTTTITNWLLHAGFLEVSAREGGGRQRAARRRWGAPLACRLRSAAESAAPTPLRCTGRRRSASFWTISTQC